MNQAEKAITRQGILVGVEKMTDKEKIKKLEDELWNVRVDVKRQERRLADLEWKILCLTQKDWIKREITCES